MSRRNAPFDAYLRSPDSPLPSMPQSTGDRIPSGISPASSMPHPYYNSALKSAVADAGSFNYPYSSPYSAQHSSFGGLSPVVLDNVPHRNSSGASSSRSEISPHLDLPPLTIPPAYHSGNNNSGDARSAAGSGGGLQFQIPSFLGGVSTVAPDGGGEVINAPGVSFLPSFSVSGSGISTMHHPMNQYSGWASNNAANFDTTDKNWLTKQTYVSLRLSHSFSRIAVRCPRSRETFHARIY